MKKYLIALVVLGIFSLAIVFVSAHETQSLAKKVGPQPGETHHLEVKPESLEGYRIPYMKVSVTMIEQDTKQSKTVELHPMFGGNFHYGANVILQPKQYSLRFHLEPPTFMRGHAREDQWFIPVDAEFTFDATKEFEKSIKVGEKKTDDMKISFETEHAEDMFMLTGTEEEHALHGDNENGKKQTPLGASNQLLTVILSIGVGLVVGFLIARFSKRIAK